MRRKKRWSDYTPAQQKVIGVLSALEVVLAVTAWYDLARRPATLVRGSKKAWAAAIAINIIGPLAYFRYGRASQSVARHS